MPIQTEVVEYEHEGTKLKGYLAYRHTAKGKRPGVLVFPEWWGLNEYAKSRADQLAGMGYVAFAADVYGGGKVIGIEHPDDAAKRAAGLRSNQMMWRGRAEAAFEALKNQPFVNPSQIGALGYCLDTALQLAYTGADLKAVATFHSILPKPTDAEAMAIRAELLVCVGGADPFIPPKAIEAFRTPLEAAGVKLEVVSYPGVLHSFTSPTADRLGNPALKYDKAADDDSWRRMEELFKAAFGKP